MQKDIIAEYYRCFAEMDREPLNRILTEDFQHRSPFGDYEGRDAMLDTIWPTVGNSKAVDIKIFGEGDTYMVKYRVTGAYEKSMAEYIEFREGRMSYVEVFIGK